MMDEQERKDQIVKQAQEIVNKKFQLEESLLKALGFKFDLAIESFTLTSGPRGPRVVISQKHVQTGSQIGLLGKAIYNVDFNLSLQPSTNRDEPLFWWGSMDLDWYHPNGGHNGQTIGDVRYLPYETDYIDMRNVKGVFQIKA